MVNVIDNAKIVNEKEYWAWSRTSAPIILNYEWRILLHIQNDQVSSVAQAIEDAKRKMKKIKSNMNFLAVQLGEFYLCFYSLGDSQSEGGVTLIYSHDPNAELFKFMK